MLILTSCPICSVIFGTLENVYTIVKRIGFTSLFVSLLLWIIYCMDNILHGILGEYLHGTLLDNLFMEITILFDNILYGILGYSCMDILYIMEYYWIALDYSWI